MVTEKKYLKSLEIANTYLQEQKEMEWKKYNETPLVKIVDSDITVRLYNILNTNGIIYLNEMSTMSIYQIMKWKHFGKKTLKHLEEELEYRKIPMGWK
jgi:DNA-directed RNA polymerase alpha subunit